MTLRLHLSWFLLFVVAATARAAPPVEVEIATERGVQITAPHEWLQLFASIGIHNVRIRGLERGDEPAVTNRGTSDRPRYHVVGILTAREQLQLTGGTFGRRDRARLRDYFDRLAADGAERLTAPRDHYGLTEAEMEAVFADLTRPIDFATKGQPPRSVLDRLEASFALRFALDARAEGLLRGAAPVADEVERLAAGTGLAIVLRSYGLVLRPEKPRGEPVVLRIAAADGATLARSTLGKTDGDAQPFWPIGWEPDGLPRELAPSLFESISAEIDGYTLEETLAAITPRLDLPLFLDHAALERHGIDPTAVQIKLPRTQISYKRVLDRVLAQARLGGQLRVDEAGTPFLWATR